MTISPLLQSWKDLPPEAQESVVTTNFVVAQLFDTLGFNQRERIPEFQSKRIVLFNFCYIKDDNRKQIFTM